MEKVQETTLEIDLKALSHNYQYLKSKLKADTALMATVKAFGYGSDAVSVAKHLETLGVDYFAVAYSNEGIALRKAGLKTPIMVLHPLPKYFEKIIDHHLEPSLYSLKAAKEFIKTSKKKQLKNYPVHLKFNTGLNRLGISKKQVDQIIDITQQASSVKVVSLFSHLAAPEIDNRKEFTEQQILDFKDIANHFIEKTKLNPKLHICNTSGILKHPKAHFDMVRSGIGLYGFGNHQNFDSELIPIATLKTIILQIHKLSPGDAVGYECTYVAKNHQTIATLPLGHADGIARAYGNGKGWVTIHGKKAPIVGNVCMDVIMVNVSHIDCSEGDEAVVFGKETTASQLAERGNTISYELIAAISQRVQRLVYR